LAGFAPASRFLAGLLPRARKSHDDSVRLVQAESQVVAGTRAHLAQQRAGDTAAREAVIVCDLGSVLFSSSHTGASFDFGWHGERPPERGNRGRRLREGLHAKAVLFEHLSLCNSVKLVIFDSKRVVRKHRSPSTLNEDAETVCGGSN
jgi:hypothetical protein